MLKGSSKVAKKIAKSIGFTDLSDQTDGWSLFMLTKIVKLQ